MAMGGVVQLAPKPDFRLVQPAPRARKSLKWKRKKPIPLRAQLVGCNALFLLAKTPVAESCMTCVEIMRSGGPIF